MERLKEDGKSTSQKTKEEIFQERAVTYWDRKTQDSITSTSRKSAAFKENENRESPLALDVRITNHIRAISVDWGCKSNWREVKEDGR